MFKTLAKSTVIGLIQKVVSALGFFFILPLMLNKLGSTTFGIWMTISSSVSLISFLDLGMGNTLMNYIALNNKNKAGIAHYIKLAYTIQLGFIGSLVMVFLICFNYVNWGAVLNIKLLSNDVLGSILITVICFLLSLITNSIYTIQKGLQKSMTANTWQLFSTLTYLAGLYFILMFKANLRNIALATFGLPLIISNVNTVMFIYKEKIYKSYFTSNISFKEVIAFMRNSSLMLFIQVAGLICFETDCLILAHYTNYNDVARFTVVARIYSIPTVLLGVYLQILWPAYTYALSNNQWFSIKKAFRNTLFFTVIIVVGFVAITLIFKDILLKHWLTNQLNIPLSLFAAFSFWVLINNIDSNIATLLNGLEKIKIQVYWAVIMVAANVFFSILLVKNYGAAGVIWGSCIASLFCSVIPLLFYIKKIFKQNTLVVSTK